MFLIKAIKNYFYPPVHIVLVMGLDNSGKTTLLHMLHEGIHQDLMPGTLGRNYNGISREMTVVDNMQLIVVNLQHLRYLDVKAAIEALKIEGIVFMVDLNDKERFEEAFNALKALHLNINMPDNIPIAILGSKLDRKEAISLEELQNIFFLDGDLFKNIKVFTCSIVKRLGLREPFEWLRSQFQN